MKPRVLSGMRPTGKLHIGHYFGALQNWVKLQEDHDCFFMIAERNSGTRTFRTTRSSLGHPDKCNVFTYHNLYNDRGRVATIQEECTGAKIGCVECKQELSEKVRPWLRPIQERREQLLSDPRRLSEIIRHGNEKARQVAKQTIKEVREAIFG